MITIEASLAVRSGDTVEKPEIWGQLMAGGLPQKVEPWSASTWIRLDGNNEDEILYKYLINAASVLEKHLSGENYEKFCERIREVRTKLETALNKTPA
jgi:hypothetical protein